jgi:hypothetical protein
VTRPTRQREQEEAGAPDRRVRAPAASLLDRVGNAGLSALRARQAKRAVSAPSDPLEVQADRVAEQVAELPGRGGAAGPAPMALGEGDPLPAPVRGQMEARFERSFADVRVHTGERAAGSAAALAARAYTVGRDIVFGAGAYAPETPEGKRLLAHELAHVVQQGADSGAPVSGGAASERDADRAAAAVVSGGRAEVATRAPAGAVQREPEGAPPVEVWPSGGVWIDDDFVVRVVRDPGLVSKVGSHWDANRRVMAVTLDCFNRSGLLQKVAGADAALARKGRTAIVTLVDAFTRKQVKDSKVIGIKRSTPPKPKPPVQKPPPGPPGPQPEVAPGEEVESETRFRPAPTAASVEAKASSEPRQALEDAEALPPPEMKRLGPQTRKDLLRAASEAPDKPSSDLVLDLVRTTPDQDAGGVSDALHEDGDALLDALQERVVSPEEAAALGDAARDLEERRVDVPPGKQIVEMTPELRKVLGETKKLLEDMARPKPSLTEDRSGEPGWEGFKDERGKRLLERQLDDIASWVELWDEAQSGWAAFASIPSHLLVDASFGTPKWLVQRARRDVQKAVEEMAAAKTLQEFLIARGKAQATLDWASEQFFLHRERVYLGAGRTITGIKATGLTAAAVVAPQVVIPGALAGGGFGALHQVASIADDPRREFQGEAVLDAAVFGGFAAPFVEFAPALGYGFAGYGLYAGGSEIAAGNTWTGIVDIGGGALGLKVASGRVGPYRINANTVRAFTMRTMMGLEEVPALGGRPAAPSLPILTEGPVALTLEPTPRFAPEPIRSGGTWESWRPSSGVPERPVSVQIAEPATAAASRTRPRPMARVPGGRGQTLTNQYGDRLTIRDGRVDALTGELRLAHIDTGTGTTQASRTAAQAHGAVFDAGHLRGRLLGGRGGLQGTFPQWSHVNRGAFMQFEQRLASLVRNMGPNDQIQFSVQPRYASAEASTPSQVYYQVRINGRTVVRALFSNKPGRSFVRFIQYGD